jgi:ribosomal protein S18 acetylase RimI-like enzyme
MEEKDFKRVCEIWLKGIKETAPPLTSGESWDSKLPNFKKDMQNDENEKYVYDEDGIIKGFIIAGILNGSPYMYDLYVDSDFRGKGIGTKLLDKLRKTYRYLTGHVYEYNHYLKFYMEYGFEVIGKHPCPDTGKVKFKIRW